MELPVHCIGSSVDPYIAYWPTTILAAEGSDITVTCYAVAMGARVNAQFTLTRDNVTLSSNSSNLNKYVFSSSVLLHNVTQSDGGEYTCQLFDVSFNDMKTGALIVYEGIVMTTTFLVQ